MSFPDWESLSRSRPSAVALGNFDGVHLGHRRILEELLSESERRGLDPVAWTFDPHPRVFFFPEKSTHLLTPPREKEGLLRAFGVEAITVNFNVGLAGLEAAEFAREILMGRLRGAAFFLGPGHRFGKKALGNSELLRDVLGGDSGQVREIAPVESMGEIISSSAIRHHLKAGQIPEANAMLGRPYSLRGLVERGAERGRSLGFPTANLRLEDDRKALPAFGVYGGVARIVEGIFPPIGQHPGRHTHTPLGNQAAITVSLFAQALDGVLVDAAVDRHKGNTIGALLLDQVEEQLCIQSVGIAVPAGRLAEGLIKWDVPHRQIDGGNDFTADPVQVAADGKFHQGIGARLLGGYGFTDLSGIVDDVGGGSDGGIDLGAQTLADSGDIRRLADKIPGDDDFPLGDHLANVLWRKLLVIGDSDHLRGDDALSGQFDLGRHVCSPLWSK
jgi:riboflavin kinase/FMN adenylyltransferase